MCNTNNNNIDWTLYKGDADRPVSRNAFIRFMNEVQQNKHTLLTPYECSVTAVKVAVNCKHGTVFEGNTGYYRQLVKNGTICPLCKEEKEREYWNKLREHMDNLPKTTLRNDQYIKERYEAIKHWESVQEPEYVVNTNRQLITQAKQEIADHIIINYIEE